jgi:hypothetical protein
MKLKVALTVTFLALLTALIAFAPNGGAFFCHL